MKLLILIACVLFGVLANDGVDLLNRINQERRARGLQQLCLSPSLNARALGDARDRAKRGIGGGVGTANTVPFEGFGPAKNANHAYDMMMAAIWSKNKLMGAWTHIGVGKAVTPIGYYYWQVILGNTNEPCQFIKPPPKVAPPVPVSTPGGVQFVAPVVDRPPVPVAQPAPLIPLLPKQPRCRYIDTVPLVDNRGWEDQEGLEDEDVPYFPQYHGGPYPLAPYPW